MVSDGEQRASRGTSPASWHVSRPFALSSPQNNQTTLYPRMNPSSSIYLVPVLDYKQCISPLTKISVFAIHKSHALSLKHQISRANTFIKAGAKFKLTLPDQYRGEPSTTRSVNAIFCIGHTTPRSVGCQPRLRTTSRVKLKSLRSFRPRTSQRGRRGHTLDRLPRTNCDERRLDTLMFGGRHGYPLLHTKCLPLMSRKLYQSAASLVSVGRQSP